MDAPGIPRLISSFPASAIFWAWVVEKEQPDYLCGPLWPVRLGVRTPGFHPGSRGSNPLRATSKKGTQPGAFFAFKPARKACFPGAGGTQKKSAALGGVPFAAWATPPTWVHRPKGGNPDRNNKKGTPQGAFSRKLVRNSLTHSCRPGCGPSPSKRCRPEEVPRGCRGRCPQSFWCPPSTPSSQAWTE